VAQVRGEQEEWRYAAACRGEDPTLFFAPSYFEKRREKQAREAVAKAICARCPVRIDCLDFALITRESHGVWGGFNEMERRRLLRARAQEAG
jgi:WhiB family transcriptional regulator, redox-sensing transcriptional regulator